MKRKKGRSSQPFEEEILHRIFKDFVEPIVKRKSFELKDESVTYHDMLAAWLADEDMIGVEPGLNVGHVTKQLESLYGKHVRRLKSEPVPTPREPLDLEERIKALEELVRNPTTVRVDLDQEQAESFNDRIEALEEVRTEAVIQKLVEKTIVRMLISYYNSIKGEDPIKAMIKDAIKIEDPIKVTPVQAELPLEEKPRDSTIKGVVLKAAKVHLANWKEGKGPEMFRTTYPRPMARNAGFSGDSVAKECGKLAKDGLLLVQLTGGEKWDPKLYKINEERMEEIDEEIAKPATRNKRRRGRGR